MNIIILPTFKRQLKLHLRKYPELKEELIVGFENFHKDSATALGSNIYKFRLRTKNLNKGKKKSFRVLVLLLERDNQLVPIAIFFKGDKENLSKAEINNSMEKIIGELRVLDV